MWDRWSSMHPCLRLRLILHLCMKRLWLTWPTVVLRLHTQKIVLKWQEQEKNHGSKKGQVARVMAHAVLLFGSVEELHLVHAVIEILRSEEYTSELQSQ